MQQQLQDQQQQHHHQQQQRTSGSRLRSGGSMRRSSRFSWPLPPSVAKPWHSASSSTFQGRNSAQQGGERFAQQGWGRDLLNRGGGEGAKTTAAARVGAYCARGKAAWLPPAPSRSALCAGRGRGPSRPRRSGERVGAVHARGPKHSATHTETGNLWRAARVHRGPNRLTLCTQADRFSCHDEPVHAHGPAAPPRLRLGHQPRHIGGGAAGQRSLGLRAQGQRHAGWGGWVMMGGATGCCRGCPRARKLLRELPTQAPQHPPASKTMNAQVKVKPTRCNHVCRHGSWQQPPAAHPFPPFPPVPASWCQAWQPPGPAPARPPAPRQPARRGAGCGSAPARPAGARRVGWRATSDECAGG